MKQTCQWATIIKANRVSTIQQTERESSENMFSCCTIAPSSRVVDMTTRTRKSDVYIILGKLANRTPLHYHTSQDLSNLRVLYLTFPELFV